MLFIGDVHGKFNRYLDLVKGHAGSVQVGDMGFDYQSLNHLHLTHRFIKGNHDNYEMADPHDLGDFGNWGDIGFVRGAYSIDTYRRIEGYDKFRNEELSYQEMSQAIGHIVANQPKIMVSHDAPQCVVSQFFGIDDRSHTRNGLQAIFEQHQPKVWIFGHHHKSVDEYIGDTRFICLAELETIEVPLYDV